MLIINEDDIEKAVNSTDMISAIEQAYLIQHMPSTIVPNRMHIDNGDNTLLLMPGFIKKTFGTKIVSVFPNNAITGKPVINGLMVLNDSNTGEPLAIINGNKLTAIRTGAVGATAVKYLSPVFTETIGIIGAGIQAYHQAVIIIEQHSFSKLIICDTNIEKANTMKDKISKKHHKINIETTTNSNQLVIDSDVIVTVTSSSKPVFNIDKDKLKNKTFIAIGSYKPQMQEIPLSVFETIDKVYVDTLHAKVESGDISIPLKKGLIQESDIISFSQLLTKKQVHNENGISLFKSVGMSLFDLTFAELIYNNAIEKGIGTNIKI